MVEVVELPKMQLVYVKSTQLFVIGHIHFWGKVKDLNMDDNDEIFSIAQKQIGELPPSSETRNPLQIDSKTDMDQSSQDELPGPIEAQTPSASFIPHSLDGGESEEEFQRDMALRGILRRGWIQRRTASLFNKWQIRYCQLSAHKLCIFHDDTRTHLDCCVNLSIMRVELVIQQQQLHLHLHGVEIPLEVRCFTEYQARGWEAMLSSVIHSHASIPKIHFMQSKMALYNHKDTITEHDFLSSTQTGDLLLMSTNDSQSALQRFLTNSEYDHIAMVVRFQDVVKIFQANADDGVNIYSWDQFVTQFHQYEKISLRTLNYQRKMELQPVLLKFIRSVMGKKYDLHAIKLLRKTSEDENDPLKGYFCSELVAKVYKKAGLLASERASSTYWPMDFTQRGGISLLSSATLGAEKSIILRKHLAQ